MLLCFVHVGFWIELPVQRRLYPIFVKIMDLDKWDTVYVDPTRSTGRHDSLLKRNKMKKVSKFWENTSSGGTVFFGVATYFLFLFITGKNQVRTKTHNDSS